MVSKVKDNFRRKYPKINSTPLLLTRRTLWNGCRLSQWTNRQTRDPHRAFGTQHVGYYYYYITRPSVITKVATTTFVYLRLVEPFSGYHGRDVTSL